MTATRRGPAVTCSAVASAVPGCHLFDACAVDPEWCPPGWWCLRGYPGRHRQNLHARRTDLELQLLLREAQDRMRTNGITGTAA
jgi:hypothetical protein